MDGLLFVSVSFTNFYFLHFITKMPNKIPRYLSNSLKLFNVRITDSSSGDRRDELDLRSILLHMYVSYFPVTLIIVIRR